MTRSIPFRLHAAGLVLAAALAAVPATAATLDELRASGAVVERFDGFVAVRGAATAEAQAVVDQVNAERRRIYAERAREQGAPVDQVGRVYAKEILGKAPAGTYFQAESGALTRK